MSQTSLSFPSLCMYDPNEFSSFPHASAHLSTQSLYTSTALQTQSVTNLGHGIQNSNSSKTHEPLVVQYDCFQLSKLRRWFIQKSNDESGGPMSTLLSNRVSLTQISDGRGEVGTANTTFPQRERGKRQQKLSWNTLYSIVLNCTPCILLHSSSNIHLLQPQPASSPRCRKPIFSSLTIFTSSNGTKMVLRFDDLIL